jgi:hypothetical protein
LHQSIASEQKKKYFEQVRQKLLEAQHNHRLEEEYEAEAELLRMFGSKEEYEHAMRLYEEY